MITLYLFIGDGDPQIYSFRNKYEFLDFINELNRFDSVWLLTAKDDSAKGEIIITENLETLLNSVSIIFSDQTKEFHIQQYESYEGAYEVALNMREPNVKCYDK